MGVTLTYVPIDPETRTVHAEGYSYLSNDRTMCGERIPWMRAILYVGENNPICKECYPTGELV